MKSYLIYFGSSDGFEFEAFDLQTGDSDSFKNRFRQFDQLDPKFLVTDDLSNKPVFGKYRIVHSGINISILKIYQCAQSNISSRIGGSNIGVALVSEQNLSFNSQNLKVLKSLLEEFTSKALHDGKFKEKSFTALAQNLFQLQRNLQHQISFDDGTLTNANLNGNSVFVTDNLNDSTLEKVNSIGQSFLRYYVCSDLNFVQNAQKTKVFVYYREKDGRFITSNDFDRIIQEEERKRNLANNKLNEQQSSHSQGPITSQVSQEDSSFELKNLQDRIDKANTFIARQDKKIKRWKLLFFVTLSVFLGFFIYKTFVVEEKKEVQSVSDQREKKSLIEFIEINKLKDYIESKDAKKLKDLSEFLNLLSKECGQDNKLDSITNLDKYKEIIQDYNLK